MDIPSPVSAGAHARGAPLPLPPANPFSVADSEFRPRVVSCFAALSAVAVPAPLLAVEACLSTSTLWVLVGDDDTWGEHRPPTAGSGVSDTPVAVTSGMKMNYLSHVLEEGFKGSLSSTLFAGTTRKEEIDNDIIEAVRDDTTWKVPLDQGNFDKRQTRASVVVVMKAVLRTFNPEITCEKQNSEDDYNSLFQHLKSKASKSVFGYFLKNWHHIRHKWVTGLTFHTVFSSIDDFVDKLFIVLKFLRLERDRKAVQIVQTLSLVKSQHPDITKYFSLLTPYSFMLVKEKFETKAEMLSFTTINRCRCKFYIALTLSCRHIFKSRQKKIYHYMMMKIYVQLVGQESVIMKTNVYFKALQFHKHKIVSFHSCFHGKPIAERTFCIEIFRPFFVIVDQGPSTNSAGQDSRQPPFSDMDHEARLLCIVDDMCTRDILDRHLGFVTLFGNVFQKGHTLFKSTKNDVHRCGRSVL
ncbi:hypothetical protein AGLY_003404 [Aphis glycines]|uniref:Uncharacterized protein n=1 Tax=Aphis glycines TaxID=307491 RepID=A0A6G0TZY0_APHGL|nr:hypothetical protein AGLY_003404 [Aphis glycines]